MTNKTLKISLLFLAFALLVACSNKRTEEKPKTAESQKAVTTSKVITIDYSDKIRTTGRLTFSNEFKLSFKTAGIVESINVKEGEYVKKGWPMASLKLNEMNALVSQVEIAMEKAKRDYNRAKALYTDSVATLEQMQNAESQLRNIEMNLQTAKFNLKHSKISAPSNGIVQKIMVQENEICSAGYPVIIFGSESKGKVLITNLSDADIVKIAVGDKASLNFDPYPENVFEGKVNEIAGMANPLTGTYEVKIEIADGENKLKPGFIGSAYIQSSIRHQWLEIPIEALVSSDKRIGQVYVFNGGKVVKRRVVIERILEDSLLISSGLSMGEKVVVSDFKGL